MNAGLTNIYRQWEVSQLLLWTVRAGILLVLVTPLVVTPSALFPYVVGKALFARSVIEVTFACWLILIFYYPQHRPARSWVIGALSVWLLVSLIAGFAGVSPVRSLWSNFERMQGVIDLAHWCVLVLVAGSVFRSFSGWRLLFTLNLGVAVVVSTLGLIQHYDLFDSPVVGDSERIESTLGNAAYMGAYAMVNSIIGLGLLFQSLGRSPAEPEREPAQRRQWSRAARRRARPGGGRFPYLPLHLPLLQGFWLLAALVCLWTLWLTATRGAVVGLGAGVITFAVGYILWGSMRRARRACYVILAVSVVAVALVMVARFSPALDPLVNSSSMLQRLNSIGYVDNSVRGRLVSLQVGVRAYQEKPILGWGPENYLVVWGRYLPPGNTAMARFDQAHNKVLEELVTKGAMGLLTYMLVWLAMAVVLVRSVRRRQRQDQFLVLALSGALVAFFVQNLFLFDTPVTAMQLAFLMAFVVSEERQCRDREENLAQENGPEAPATRRGAGGWREALGLRRRFDWMFRELRTLQGGALAVVALTALTIWLLFNYNVKPYNAAQAANLSINSASWSEAAAHFNRSAEAFPALANIPRSYLIIEAADNIESVPEEEFTPAVALITVEGWKALNVEPQNWYLHAKLAHFYQRASLRNLEYLEDAGKHAREAFRLAPNIPQPRAVWREQERLERQLAN